jgi:two-component system, cell cycle sensor histidine kinase PleC
MAPNPSAERASTATAARVRAKVSEAELKAVRGRLQSGSSIEPAFEHELLSIFAKNEIRAAVTMPALSVIFSLASMFWAPKHHAVIWLMLVILTKVWLLWQCGKFLADQDGAEHIAKWRRRFIWAELLTGLSWAGFVLVGIDPQIFTHLFNHITASDILREGFTPTPIEFSANVFVFATLIVILAIRMTFAATVIPILYAGTIPMTMAVVARLAITADPFCLALAAMAVGVHLYFVWLARGLNSTAIDRLKYRAQKDLLISALEEEKAISEEARRRAEEANKAKSRFLATMSHELRTPLNAIMGFSEVMQTEILGPMANPTYKDYAGNIHDSGRHLLNLINEILDLSRIEAGRYELTEERLHLADVADDCHRLLRLRAEAKGLQIIENIPSNLPLVWADQRALRQICLNLMSNALKFTPKGGSITITIAVNEAGEQLLSVRDTGPGIPADEIPKVLQAFGQGSLAHQTAEGGTGLGLSIVQNLIELHGGVFELKSELRKGTEAIITLPRGRVLAASPPLQPLGSERHKVPPAGPVPIGKLPQPVPVRAARLIRAGVRPITARARA